MSWLRDPLFAFLVIGALIFALARTLAEPDAAYDINIGEADIRRLQDHWTTQMRRAPTEQEFDELLDEFVRDEIYYRESQRLGLDASDSIVRRRLVQKLTFLTEDIALAKPFDAAGLRSFYEQNTQRYLVPQRFTFSHRYFSSDRRSDARGDALAALASADSGDPFMLQLTYRKRSEKQIAGLFGRNFARSLATLEPGDAYQGPIESAYGWHLVRVVQVHSAFVPDLQEVADRVLADAKQAAKSAANDVYYEGLKSRYNVTYPDGVLRQ